MSPRSAAGEAEAPLSRGLIARYSFAAIPMALPTLPLAVWLPTFYAENTQLSLTTVGAVLLLARCLDLLSDLLAARYCDQALAGPGVWGRKGSGENGLRRGWMLFGLLLAAPALPMLFNPSDTSGSLELFFWVTLLYLGWTLIQIPWQSWIADLTSQYQQRLRLTSSREALGLVGLVLSAAIPSVVTVAGGSLQDGLNALVIVALVLAVPAIWAIRSVPDGNKKSQGATHTTSFRSLLSLRHNGIWTRLLMAWGLNTLANSVAAVLFPLVVTYAFGGSEQDRALLLLVYFMSAVLAMPAVLSLGKSIDRHRLWCFSMMVAVVVFALVPLLGADRFDLFLAVCVLTGAVLGADLALPPAMQADAVDWDRFRFRKERPNACFAGHNLTMKLAMGLSVWLGPWLLGLGDWTLETASASNRDWLLVIYAILPCVLKAVAIGLMWNFPLSRYRHQLIETRLQQRLRHDQTATE